ncbi:hypothetical protein [Hymenobacter cellulosilyticus]|nr:hypothetical protein [Hymenobacter cellulosilyticus]
MSALRRTTFVLGLSLSSLAGFAQQAPTPAPPAIRLSPEDQARG